MSADENKATIRRVIDALKKGNLGIIDEAFSPNFAFHSHINPNGPLCGLEGARTMVTNSAFSDLQVMIEDIFGEGDKVAVRVDLSRHLPRGS